MPRLYVICCLCTTIALAGAQNDCDSLLDASALAAVNAKISDNAVVLFGMPDMRCTLAAEEVLAAKGVCFEEQTLEGEDDPVLLYMKCIHADAIGDIGSAAANMYHSYLYVSGEYVGDGFKAETVTDFGDASLDCKADCKSIISADALKEMEETIAKSPVALYGWAGCPCTGIAQARLGALGTCYMQAVWPDTDDPAFKYLQCVHGEENHSFLFFGGKFFGNGFALDPTDLSDADFEKMLTDAGASNTCTKDSDLNLGGSAIKSCTQSDDGTTTGWTRSGSCNWAPEDSGYHEVCVTMSDEFLKNSAEKDGNDLSSVVDGGGHWCICAWAFASAVERDPENLEGIHLECDMTNQKLRDVYQHYIDEDQKITSPSGIGYEASTALEYINKLCGESTIAAVTDVVDADSAIVTTELRQKQAQMLATEAEQQAAVEQEVGPAAVVPVAAASIGALLVVAVAVALRYRRIAAATTAGVREEGAMGIANPITPATTGGTSGII